MVKILIDTNRYLDLYWSEEDIHEVLGDIMELKSYLVFPDIVFDEFMRNRQRVMDRMVKQLKGALIPDQRWPFFLRQEPDFSLVLQNGEEYNQAVQSLAADLDQMISGAERDPIFSAVSKFYRDQEVTVLERTAGLIELAHRRKLIGNPPKSDDTPTIGDELIWEMVLQDVHDDLVLVTRDHTYRNHALFLMTEYREKTGKALTITEYISYALQQIGKSPTDSLLRFEGRQDYNADRTASPGPESR